MRALPLLVVLLATAASSADLATASGRARERSSQEPQWAPSGNFSALHGRAVFPSETRSGAGAYAREGRETAAAKRIWTYAAGGPARYVDPDGRWELDYGYAGERPAIGVEAEAYAFAYRAYRQGVQAAGQGVHWAAWHWTEAAEGMLSLPTSTPGVYASTPESRAVASSLGAGVELSASLPVGIAGLGLMPEMLWNSPEEFQEGRAEMREGQNSSNEEQYLTGLARVSGTIGLWAGTASFWMSKVPVLNDAPVSQFVRPSNWSRIETPPNSVQANTVGLSAVWKYTGPRRSTARGIEHQTISLSDPEWRERTFKNSGDSIVYVLRDASGEVLKTGKTEVTNFVERFEPYRRAGERTGRALEVEAFAFDAEGFTAETLETSVRDWLSSQGHAMPWDNTMGRLGREGPGVPGAPIPRRLREAGWTWDYEGEVLLGPRKSP